MRKHHIPIKAMTFHSSKLIKKLLEGKDFIQISL